jgi:acetyl-CoA C-acetyltransferase
LTNKNLTPLAVLGESTVIGVDPHIMGIGPVPAIRKLLEKTGTFIEFIDPLTFAELNRPKDR